LKLNVTQTQLYQPHLHKWLKIYEDVITIEENVSSRQQVSSNARTLSDMSKCLYRLYPIFIMNSPMNVHQALMANSDDVTVLDTGNEPLIPLLSKQPVPVEVAEVSSDSDDGDQLLLPHQIKKEPDMPVMVASSPFSVTSAGPVWPHDFYTVYIVNCFLACKDSVGT
jgi:hypothetical protein